MFNDLRLRFGRRAATPVAMLAAAVLLAIGLFHPMPGDVLSTDGREPVAWEPEISPMGAIARGDVPMPTREEYGRRVEGMRPEEILGLQGDDRLVHSPTAIDFQSETTIAQNGNFVVVGYNDIRGFFLPAVSVSGYSYSSDGGVTWTDGGQLPTLGPADQVFGDPDVKTWTDPSGNVLFVFSSLYRTAGGASSLCLHVSTDGGATWSPPREVTAATSFTLFADKEFIGVDPETGRVFISWTSFGNPTTMRVAYSDDFGLTWSAPTVFGSNIGQGSIPRAAGNSDNAYVAWRTSSTIQLVRSTDNGVTWSGPTSIASGLANPMNPYGSDRIHGFPSMDVDNTNGNVYVNFASRNNFPDFSDVWFIRSTDGGVTWSAPVTLNANPGSDRAQFFSWLSVDQSDGRIDAIWYDQINGAGTSDITDVFHSHSWDNGVTWSCPTPLTDAPFHAEYGNTTSQPNIGDYNQCVSDEGTMYTAFAKTGAPSHLTFAPDTYVDIHNAMPPDAPIGFVDVSFVDIGCGPNNGYLEPTEVVNLDVTLRNYSDCVNSISNIQGTLSTMTPGITVTIPDRGFDNLGGAGSTGGTLLPFGFTIAGNVVCGTHIDFLLTLTSSEGEAVLPFQMRVGRPQATPLLSENFDGVAAPALPPGWTSSNLAGAFNPWVTSTTFAASGPNSAFCADIATTSANELVSPVIAMPVIGDLLDITFDITHNIELHVERRAWDGALMLVDVNGSRFLAGSFASLFEPFYPWQVNRGSSNSQPIQDLSCWSSDVTPNFNQVHIQYPGLGGSNVRLSWVMGTDPSVGTNTGMFVDNLEVNSIDFVCTCTDTTLPVTIQAFDARGVDGGVELEWRIFADEEIAGFKILRGAAGEPTEYEASGGRLLPSHLRRFVDENVQVGRDYDYALVVVTADGSELRSQQVTGRAIGYDLALRQNHPNPFNPTTTISFVLPADSEVSLEVFDARGSLVATLVEGTRAAGEQSIVWDGRNDAGQRVGTGVYFYRLRTGNRLLTKKMVMLK